MSTYRRDTGRRTARITETDDLDPEATSYQRVDEPVQPRVGDVVTAGDDGYVDVQTSSMVERAVRLTPRKSV